MVAMLYIGKEFTHTLHMDLHEFTHGIRIWNKTNSHNLGMCTTAIYSVTGSN